MSAVVIMGEAPESEEENDEIDFVTITGDQFTDDLVNPPETPPSPSPDFPRSKETRTSSSPSNSQQQHQPQQSKLPNDELPLSSSSSSSSSSMPPANQYDTPLHRKLREKNETLREELVKIACQPYLNAVKEIDSLTQQLSKSQKMVQQVSGTLTKLTGDLKSVEITLDSYQLDSSVIPMFTNKLTQSSSSSLSSPRKQPDIKSDASPQDKLSSSSTST